MSAPRYALSVLEGELALEGAHAADRLAALRRRKGGTAAERDARAKLELHWQKAFTERLRDLRVRLDRRPRRPTVHRRVSGARRL